MLTVLLIVGFICAPVLTIKLISGLVGLVAIPATIIGAVVCSTAGGAACVVAIGVLVFILCMKILFCLN